MPATSVGELAGTVAVLSAMITPAVLISACGSLAISTSNRLGRTIDRTRRLAEQFAQVAAPPTVAGDPGGAPDGDERRAEQRAVLFDLLGRATQRSQLLQRAMTRIYLAIGVFVATSVAIGLVAVTGARYSWVPVTLGLAGAGLLFHASVLLIVESRIALGAVQTEMAFVWRTGQQLAPSALVEQHRPRRRFRRRGEAPGPDG